MSIKEHVVSKDLAQDLWDKGVKVDSYFTWFKDTKYNNGYFVTNEHEEIHVPGDLLYPAPMLSELLDLMPVEFKTNIAGFEEHFLHHLYKSYDNSNPKVLRYYSQYMDYVEDSYLDNQIFIDPKAVDAVGKTLLWLIDNGYYKVEDSK